MGNSGLGVVYLRIQNNGLPGITSKLLQNISGLPGTKNELIGKTNEFPGIKNKLPGMMNGLPGITSGLFRMTSGLQKDYKRINYGYNELVGLLGVRRITISDN